MEYEIPQVNYKTPQDEIFAIGVRTIKDQLEKSKEHLATVTRDLETLQNAINQDAALARNYFEINDHV